MKALTISIIMIAITIVGSLSLILAINHDTGNLENDAKKIEIQERDTPIETTEIPSQIIQYPQTTITKLNDQSSVKTIITTLHIPKNNTFPFGLIKGNIANPTEGYPVILQIFKSLEEGPIHIAQIDLEEDNTFEYSFRILSIDDGITTHHYQGDYLVKIIQVINTLMR